MHRRFSFHRAAHGLAGALCIVLLACSGGKDVTGPGLPDDDPPPGPVDPGPGDPGPVDPGPGDPGPVDPGPGPVNPGPTQPGIIAGTYTLTQINNSTPGQTVTVANPDGQVIGLYRFQASTTLILDPLGGYSLSIEYQDEKGDYSITDVGEYKWTGTDGGVVQLSFSSATWGDAFEGAAATDGSAAFRYDFDGDGQADTVFGFQQVTGG
jgi:hypothetical protein